MTAAPVKLLDAPSGFQFSLSKAKRMPSKDSVHNLLFRRLWETGEKGAGFVLEVMPALEQRAVID